jgi:hypothetical protein
VRLEGYVARTKQAGTAPLKTFFHGGTGDNYSTGTAAGRRAALSGGYSFARTEGYVFKNKRGKGKNDKK